MRPDERADKRNDEERKAHKERYGQPHPANIYQRVIDPDLARAREKDGGACGNGSNICIARVNQRTAKKEYAGILL